VQANSEISELLRSVFNELYEVLANVVFIVSEAYHNHRLLRFGQDMTERNPSLLLSSELANGRHGSQFPVQYKDRFSIVIKERHLLGYSPVWSVESQPRKHRTVANRLDTVRRALNREPCGNIGRLLTD
jgi:hypothetical protein